MTGVMVGLAPMVAAVDPESLAHRLWEDLFPPLVVGQTPIHVSVVGLVTFGVFVHVLATLLPPLMSPHSYTAESLPWLLLAAVLLGANGALVVWIAVDPAGFVVTFAGYTRALRGTPR